MLNFCKVFNILYFDHSVKLITNFWPIDSAQPIEKFTVKSTILSEISITEPAWARLVINGGTNKYTKKSKIFNFYLVFDLILIAGKDLSVK